MIKKVSIVNCGKKYDINTYPPNESTTSCINDRAITTANGQLAIPGIDPQNEYIIYSEIAIIAIVSVLYHDDLMYSPKEAPILTYRVSAMVVFGIALKADLIASLKFSFADSMISRRALLSLSTQLSSIPASTMMRFVLLI